ncbi:unnamed protein product [Withania somnifera]
MKPPLLKSQNFINSLAIFYLLLVLQSSSIVKSEIWSWQVINDLKDPLILGCSSQGKDVPQTTLKPGSHLRWNVDVNSKPTLATCDMHTFDFKKKGFFYVFDYDNYNAICEEKHLCSWHARVDGLFYGVVVSTLDFESSDLGSTPGRTFLFLFCLHFFKQPIEGTIDIY